MMFETINIKINDTCVGAKSGVEPKMIAYLPSNSDRIDINLKRKTVLLLPGGGYRTHSERETEPVALRLMAKGFNVFVLYYSVEPATFPTSLCEVATAIALIRENYQKWNVDVNGIVVGGFSAGGHLTGSIGTLWHTDFLEKQTGLKKEQYRPNGLMLGYSVVTTSFTHMKSINRLVGGIDEFKNLVSNENNVTIYTPKSFIWHTYTDEMVPMESSLMMANALKKCDIPFELHIFPNGPHGLSLCDESTASKPDQINPQASVWFDMFVTWLKNL